MYQTIGPPPLPLRLPEMMAGSRAYELVLAVDPLAYRRNPRAADANAAIAGTAMLPPSKLRWPCQKPCRRAGNGQASYPSRHATLPT